MFSSSRRAFLGASLAGLVGGRLLGADVTEPPPKVADDAAFRPDTLLLTWQRDPTTTMTIQWVGVTGETSDTKVSYGMVKGEDWKSQATTAKAYPLSDFKVFRTELTGLTPGTDYQFRIGKSPT